MKTFVRKRNSPDSPPAAPEEPPAYRSRSQGSPDWGLLPDVALSIIANELGHEDRITSRLVCCGWRSALGATVERLTFPVHPLPTLAVKRLNILKKRFPAVTSLSLQFPNFLPPPPPCNPNGQPARACDPSHAPLLATLPMHLTHLSINLAAAGLLLLPLPLGGPDRLPHLTSLTIRGISPHLPQQQQHQQRQGPTASDAGACAGAGAGALVGSLGLAPMAGRLTHMALAGSLSYRVLVEVAQVTSLTRLALEGRAHVDRSEFMYMAALRRLSRLSRLEHLTIEGPLFAVAGEGAAPAAAAAGGHLGAGAGAGAPAGLTALALVPSLDCAAAVAALSCLTALTALELASAPPSCSLALGGGPAALSCRYSPCSFLQLPVHAFPSLQHLRLEEPGRLDATDLLWVEGLGSRPLAHTAIAAPSGLVMGLGGGGGGGGGGCGVGGGLRSLSLAAAGGSSIIDDLPYGFGGLTSLALLGLQLDSLAPLVRLRGLADLRLHVPLAGCDSARRHSVALLSSLRALTRLELRAGGAQQGAVQGGVGAGGPGGRSAGGLASAPCGEGGEQLLLNDGRLQALARGCRRLRHFSFHGALQVSDQGGASLASYLPYLARLELSNDSDAPAAVHLGLLPPTIETLSLYNVAVAVPQHHQHPQQQPDSTAYGWEARPDGTASTAAQGSSGGTAARAGKQFRRSSAAALAQQRRAVAVDKGSPPACAASTAAASNPGSSTPHAGGHALALPVCKTLHLDFCGIGLGAWGPSTAGGGGGGGGGGLQHSPPLWRVLQCFGPQLLELRVQVAAAGLVAPADAAAVAALPRLRKLQLTCLSGELPEYTLCRMLAPCPVPAPAPTAPTAPGASAAHSAPTDPKSTLLADPSWPLSCLSLRLPATHLTLATLRAIARVPRLALLYLDVQPPTDAGQLRELCGAAGLTQLTLGSVYGRDCARQPAVLPVLGQLQGGLLLCRIQQAC